MTSIITELVTYLKGPAEGRLRVREFLATLKTHWWPSAIDCSMVGCCRFDTFPISFLYLILLLIIREKLTLQKKICFVSSSH